MYNLLNSEYKKHYHDFDEFVKENIEPYAYEWEKTQQIPQDFIELCAKKNYLGCCIPEQFGGNNWDVLTYGLFIN